MNVSAFNLCTHRSWNPKGLPRDGGPPDHKVGEAGNPEDAADEGDRVPLAGCKTGGRTGQLANKAP